mmetsp:Transcript_11012/g.27088  ORF Transcript_11012/g.27088 Transcript_11012/m.27088 type:complete len:217 (-) Transcript_11012:149-799(-)
MSLSLPSKMWRRGSLNVPLFRPYCRICPESAQERIFEESDEHSSLLRYFGTIVSLQSPTRVFIIVSSLMTSVLIVLFCIEVTNVSPSVVLFFLEGEGGAVVPQPVILRVALRLDQTLLLPMDGSRVTFPSSSSLNTIAPASSSSSEQAFPCLLLPLPRRGKYLCRFSSSMNWRMLFKMLVPCDFMVVSETPHSESSVIDIGNFWAIDNMVVLLKWR